MKRYKIGQKGFTNNYLLNFNAVLETKDETPNVFYDVIYVEFSNPLKNERNQHIGYDTKNKIDIKFNTYELRIFKYALKSFLTNKTSIYKKHNNPTLSDSKDNVKEITLGFKNEKYFINAEEYGKTKIGIPFDSYELRALIDCIDKLANECDEILYKYQRAIDKSINQN